MHKAPRLKKDMGIYGRQAYQYARWTMADMEEYNKLATLVASQVRDGDKILEVAPGPGYTVIGLAKLGNYSISAMDISPAFVDIGRKNALEAGVSINFVQGNVSSIPFEENSFDFVFNRAAFKNFKEPVKALNEMFRILKPGGKVLIQDLRPDISMKAINDYIDKTSATFSQKLVQKIIFRFFLKRSAHSKEEFKEFLAATPFLKYIIKEDNPVVYEIWLYK